MNREIIADLAQIYMRNLQSGLTKRCNIVAKFCEP